MKNNIISLAWCVLFLFFPILKVFAQKEVIDVKATNNKTTSLLFPEKIIHVDLGVQSQFIGVQLDENVPKLLKIRITPEFKIKTNMLVVTEDNSVYSFNLAYADTLNTYVYIIKKEKATNFTRQVSSSPDTKKQVDSLNNSEILNKILCNQNNLTRTEVAKKGKMTMFIKNIFVYNDNLYFQIEIMNKSNLKYIIDFYNLYMKSKLKKALKSTTAQDIQIPFAFLHEEIREIKAGKIETIIILVKKFTLENDKIACLEIYEKDGGRHLKINLTNTELLSAIKL